jgi:hypothetical protein
MPGHADRHRQITDKAVVRKDLAMGILEGKRPAGPPRHPLPRGRHETDFDDVGHGGVDSGGSPEKSPVDMVRQPEKIMRVGSMIKQLLEEMRVAPLDDASRAQLKEIHHNSIIELEDGLSPELAEELERLSLPFTEKAVPTEDELRIAQAQLVGWLEGLFHGIQAAQAAQQMTARAKLDQMHRALPPGNGTTDLTERGVREESRSGLYL